MDTCDVCPADNSENVKPLSLDTEELTTKSLNILVHIQSKFALIWSSEPEVK